MSSLLALLKQKKQEIDSKNRRKTVKPIEGTSRWRILPSWRKDGSQQFWHDFGQHFVKDATGKLSAVYLCTDKTFGKPCPVCDAVRDGIKSATDDSVMNTLKEAQASGRVLVNALWLDSPKAEERVEPQVMELPASVFSTILEIATEWEAANQSIFDLAAGKDLVITRTGKGVNTKYVVQVGAAVTPVPANVMAKINDLDAYVAQESADQQLRALNSVRAVSGLLPAPSASSGLPAAAAAMGAAHIGDDVYAAAPAPVAPRPAPAASVTDAVYAVAPAPVAAAPAPAAAAPAAAAPVAAAAPAAAPAGFVSTGDPELDAMMADLG